MATPGVTFTDYQRVVPAWLGSRISDSKVITPGGIQLDVTALTTAYPDKVIPSGTLLSRTLAERDAGTGYSPADPLDDQFAVLLYDTDMDMEDVSAGVQPMAGNILYENFLPGFDGLAVGLKAKLRELYTCLVGQA
jgi:hypothetical protein